MTVTIASVICLKTAKQMQWRIQGEGPGGPDPPPPYQTWRLFETKILTWTGPYTTF